MKSNGPKMEPSGAPVVITRLICTIIALLVVSKFYGIQTKQFNGDSGMFPLQ